MRRVVLAVLVCAGMVAAMVAPGAAPSPPSVDYRPVTSMLTACPQLTAAGQATNVLGALVAAEAPGSDAADAQAQRPGSAALRPLGASEDLVRLAAPGTPVTLRAVGSSQPAFVMQSDGTWAPSALAGVVTRQREGDTQGLASAACAPPGPHWWFVGGGSELGRGTALLVSNPAEEPARFDIALHSGGGPVQALAGKGIDLGPRSSVRLRLDALAPDEELLAVEVRATSGRVAAAVRDVAVPSEDRPRGVDFIPPAQEPGTRLVVAGIPAGDGARQLVLVNPGTQFATVSPRLLTGIGREDVEGLAAIAVPAGAVIRVDLTRVLDGRSGTLDLTSDTPITGGARAEWGDASRDDLWLAGAPLIGGPDPLGGAVAAAGPGLVTTVTVAAPDAEVRGTLTALTMTSTQVAGLSGTDAPDEAPSGPLPEPVAPDVPVVTQPIQVVVPAGSKREITIPGGGEDAVAGVTTLTWQSDPGSGPAAVTHVTLDAELPLATGYPWWPVTSSVRSVAVREDIGVLAPAG